MANQDRPNGLKPTGRSLRGGTCQPANSYAVDASNATAIFIGDAMILEADGNVAPYTSGGGNLIGVCVGIADDYGDLTRRHLPATTAGNVFIVDDPDATFVIQEDDVDGSALALTDVGAFADILATAGHAASGTSRHELDRSTITTSSGQLRVLRLVPREDNAVGASADWEVLINEHLLKTTTGV